MLPLSVLGFLQGLCQSLQGGWEGNLSTGASLDSDEIEVFGFERIAAGVSDDDLGDAGDVEGGLRWVVRTLAGWDRDRGLLEGAAG